VNNTPAGAPRAPRPRDIKDHHMAYADLKFEHYRGTDKGWFPDDDIDMVQLTVENYQDVRTWLENHGCEVSFWTNESCVVGLWVANTWHDGKSKTPVPFGWWLYKDPHGDMGAASEPAMRKHYTPA
jgi:hypothetical protein